MGRRRIGCEHGSDVGGLKDALRGNTLLVMTYSDVKPGPSWAFSCVPSMNDSLEVQVLYPA
jgi:hypothetical protein